MNAERIAYLSPAPGTTDQRLAVSSAVVTLAALGGSATHGYVDIQTASVMVTFDGSDPSASNGHQFDAGDSGMWNKATIAAARFIRLGSTDAVVHMTPMAY